VPALAYLWEFSKGPVQIVGLHPAEVDKFEGNGWESTWLHRLAVIAKARHRYEFTNSVQTATFTSDFEKNFRLIEYKLDASMCTIITYTQVLGLDLQRCRLILNNELLNIFYFIQK